MKIKNKLVLSSLAIIAVAGGIVEGTTYALFTSETSVNIAVTSGKVNVDASLDNVVSYSGSSLVGDPALDESKITARTGEEALTFSCGGSVSTSGGEVSLTKMAPGDRVTFNLVIKNSSNVKSKYRYVISLLEDDGLFVGLKTKIGNASFNGIRSYSNWVELDEVDTETTIVELPCKIDLPSDAGDQYQDKSCKIKIYVEAVQGNAYTSNPSADELLIETPLDLKTIADNVNIRGLDYTGYTIMLNNDIDMNGVTTSPIGTFTSPFKGTFDGNNKTISNLTVTSTGSSAAAGLIGSCLGQVKNVILDNATITSDHYAGGIIGYSSTNVGMVIDNCVVKNSNITSKAHLINESTWDDGDKCGGIAGYIVSGDTVKNCSVNNTTIKAYRDCGGIVGYVNGTATVTNNKAKDLILNVDKTQNYNNYTQDSEYNFGQLFGHIVGSPITTDSEATNVTINY